jgi:iron complex transport system substrate-binding protein
MNNLRYIRKQQLISLLAYVISIFVMANSVFAESPERIVSLAPSTTEILFAAGLGEKIVGVTNFCDHPEEAKLKPKIGGMSNPSLEKVVSLRPDIVVMTTDGNPREFELKLHSLKIKTFVFDSLTIAELPDGIRKMGAALDEKEKFNALASDIEQSMENLREHSTASGKKVLFIVWPEPLIVAGQRTAADDAIKLLGGVNIAADALGRYPKYSIEEIFHQSPDIIFVGKGMSGKGSEDMRKIASSLLGRLAALPAVENNRVFFVSDSLFRLGPRIIDGIKELSGYMK